MCRATVTIHSVPSRNFAIALFESFTEYGKGGCASRTYKLKTCGFIIVALTVIEQTLRSVLSYLQHLSPLLEDEMSRINCAKHLGVNAVALFTCAYLGFKARHILQDMYDTVLRGKNSMSKAYDNRLFKHYPESARTAIFFLGYQVKNSYDSIIWNDGPLLIGHHILALVVALGALFPGSAHYYVPFYLGFSETSSFALSLLVNFDDEHGVKGLGDAMPVAKAVVGGLFAVLFIIFRVLLWSTISYYYCWDVYNVLQTNDPRLKGRKTFFQFTFVALGLLSILQVFWLGEIFVTGKKILEQAMDH